MPRKEYHEVQGAYPSSRPSAPDPFLAALQAEVRAQMAVEQRRRAALPTPVVEYVDTPRARLLAALAEHPKATYVRVEAIDLRAVLMEQNDA